MVASYLTKPRLPLHELRMKIRALKRRDLRHSDLDSLRTELASILHHYIHPSPLMQPGERIFRAVSWSDRPTHKQHLTYPPADKVTFGRCNRPGEPVFYGSVGSAAAIRELAPSDGARLVISMWQVKTPILVASLGYSERAFARLGSQRWPQIWWQRQDPSQPDPIGATTAENRFLDRFLASEFTKHVSKGDESQYKLSIAIAESYLKASPAAGFLGVEIPSSIRAGDTITGAEAGGLIYPSVATGANDDNIALKCIVADTSLEFVWAHYVQISRPTKKSDEFTPNGLDFASQLSPFNEIQWTGSLPNTVAPGFDLRLDTDGNSLVLKDSLNRVVGRFSDPSSK